MHIPSNKDKAPVLNEEQIAEEEKEKRDGFFAILTNIKDMMAGKIIMDYKELWKVEDAFGELKGTLRPAQSSTGRISEL